MAKPLPACRENEEEEAVGLGFIYLGIPLSKAVGRPHKIMLRRMRNQSRVMSSQDHPKKRKQRQTKMECLCASHHTKNLLRELKILSTRKMKTGPSMNLKLLISMDRRLSELANGISTQT
jgi:hypothetical protein